MPKILSNINIQTSQQGVLVDQSELEMLDGVTAPIQTQLNAKIPLSQKGANNGVAPLGADNLVPSIHLPPSLGGEGNTYNIINSSPAFVEEFDDFLSMSSINKLGWTHASNNGWSGAEAGNRFPTAKGVFVLGIYGANQSTANYSALKLGNFPIIPTLSEGYLNLEMSAVVGLTNLSMAQTDWASRFGLLDTAAGDGTNFSIMISAEYYQGAYNWIAVWKFTSGVANKQVITPVTGTLSTKIFNLKINIDCENYKIYFTADGTTLEITIAQANWLFGAMSPTFVIQREAVTGTNNRSYWVDKFLIRQNTSSLEINENIEWVDILNKPDTATRWPVWNEISSKPDFDAMQIDLDAKIPLAQKGAISGVAPLDTNSLIPSIHIPNYEQSVGFGGSTILVGVEPPEQLTLPIPISQGGTGTTTAANALGTLGAQPVHSKLTALGYTTGSGILTHSALTDGFFTRTLQVASPLSIINADGLNGNPTINLNMGVASGLDADLLDGLNSTSFLRKDTSDTLTGNLTITGNSTAASYVIGSGAIEPLGKSYGSIRVTGLGSGYAGIYFSAVDRTLMTQGSNSGMYQEGVGWDYYITSAATTILGLGKCPATTSGLLNFTYGSTNRFQFRGDGNAWNAVNGWTPNWSDENLKRDITPLNSCLDIVNQLEPVSYRWNATAIISEVIGAHVDNSTHYGFIAQRLEPIIQDIVKLGPEAVDGLETYLTYEKTEIIPFLAGAIKELSVKLDNIEQRLINAGL